MAVSRQGDAGGRGALGAELRALLASNQMGLALLIVVLVAVFATVNPGFASPFNLFSLTRVMGIDMVIGFAMMVVLVTGGLNLAVGSIGVAAVMLGGWAMQTQGLPVPVAMVIAIAMGAFLGWLNGQLTVRIGVHSFIVTLATMSIFFGAMIVLTKAEAFNALPAAFVDLGRLRYWGFVSGMLPAALIVGLGLWLFYARTSLGREILAVGANLEAARLSGIRVERAIVVAHAMSGALAALAGLMLAARNGAALPSMAGHIGMSWLLPAFLAPVLGGTLLTGGVVSVVGTALGAAMVTIITNGLLQLQVGEFWVQMFLGLILLAAVLLDRLRGVLAERRRQVR
jgi:ribose transport system permease protein